MNTTKSDSLPPQFSEKSYENALQWLYVQAPNYQQIGSAAYKPGLENVGALLEVFGNPHHSLRCIHVAGTNGKGSTCHMLSSILQSAGYTTGLYSSPHLIDFRERVKINGMLCDKAFVYDFIRRLQELPKEIQPSFFEYTTAMAFCYFAKENVDFAVIEVGLGGRLDATNIIQQPILTAITNIDMDHIDLLGNSIEKIAREKAGIAKKGVSLLCAERKPEAVEVIRSRCEEVGAQYYSVPENVVTVPCALQGVYQEHNIRLVLAMVQELQGQGIKISEGAVQDGLESVTKRTGLRGRWEKLRNSPAVVCDTAHNLAGLRAVLPQIQALEGIKYILMGFVKEKNPEELLQILPNDARYFFVKPNVARGAKPEKYAEIARKLALQFEICSSMEDAIRLISKKISMEDSLVILGSNFIVGEFLEKNLVEKLS